MKNLPVDPAKRNFVQYRRSTLGQRRDHAAAAACPSGGRFTDAVLAEHLACFEVIGPVGLRRTACQSMPSAAGTAIVGLERIALSSGGEYQAGPGPARKPSRSGFSGRAPLRT
jgi:hypothetical protein